jgi:3-methylfumaryl-CoA hydratase
MADPAAKSSWSDWLGRTEVRTDVAAPGPAHGLAALLDHDLPPWRPGELPPLAHWLYFLPHARQSQLGEDGHPIRGGFLPPISLARRLWAGGRLSFQAPIAIGAKLTRTTTIQSIASKSGAAGPVVFVTLLHEITADGRPAVREEQDLAFTGAPPLPRAERQAGDPLRPADWSRQLTPDTVALFRFSALTFNGHRIHYDAEYVQQVEGYPGLVVQGPYLATLLMDLMLTRRPGATITHYRFRASAPAFAGRPLWLGGVGSGASVELFAQPIGGAVCMQAQVTTGEATGPGGD